VADALGGEELPRREQADDEVHEPLCAPGRHVLETNAPAAPTRGGARAGGTAHVFDPGRRSPWPATALHGRDELLDALVDTAVRVLAEHSALGLVVQLQVHPVDGEVAPALLGPADEVAPQLGPRGLRRHALGLEDRE